MYPQRNGTVLRINFPDDETPDNDAIKIYNGPGILNEWKSQKKIFIPIDLTGEAKEDKKRFDLIQMEARRMKYIYDTIHILKVHFKEENTYGQFVELVNMMSMDRHKRYMFYLDNFYILGEAPPEPWIIYPN